jgi:hypothetical protein
MAGPQGRASALDEPPGDTCTSGDSGVFEDRLRAAAFHVKPEEIRRGIRLEDVKAE